MKKIYIILTLLLVLLHLQAQNSANILTGKVTAAENGELLIGVSVAELDESNRLVSSAITDMNGEFSLKLKNVKNRVRISYIGYTPEIVQINGKNRLLVKLKDNTHEIAETVIVGKKTTNDGTFNINSREVSMAMQKIDSKDFEGLSVASVDDALQGRVSGLDIVGNSGAPGSGMTMRIRGTSTITGNAEPLIVVNGIPFDGDIKSGFDFSSANEEQYANLLNVNVDDIQEIIVLKDAASTAIWGSKGANGVLMITTKKGLKGKTKVQYTYRFTQATQPKGMKMLNGDDYTMLMKQEMFNKILATTETRTVIPEFNYDPSFPEYENFNNNTDWVAAVTQKGITNDHYLTVSGGGDRAKFRISGGYYDQTGTNIGQELKRFSTRSQLDYQVSDRLRFTSEFSYTYTDNTKDYNQDKVSLLDIANKKMPNVSIYAQDANGNNTSSFYNIRSDSKVDPSQRTLMNPVALGKLGLNKEKGYRVIPTFRLMYDFFDPDKIYLRYNAYVSFDLNNVVDNDFLPYNVTSNSWSSSSVNRATGSNTEKLAVSTDNNITWQMPRNDKHALMLYASVQTNSSASTSQSAATTGLPDVQITDPTAVGYLESISTGTSKSKSIGFLTRAHYSFLNRYILDLTYRVDGSSKFGQNNQFGSFPGIGAKWIISDESFMKPTNDWLSMLAIRPSWGVAGNQPGAEYLQYSKYVADKQGYLNAVAIYPSNLQLADIRWEKVTSTNLGADLELFKGKVNFVFDWYHKRTDDLLFQDLPISPTSGFTTEAYKNIGKMDNDGWEINIDIKDVIKIEKFSMDVNMNISNYYNKIIDMDAAVMNQYNDNAGSITNGTYLTRLQVNNSFGSIYGFRYKGVYQYSKYIAGSQENAPVARDANNNVLLDYSGNPKPMYYNYKSTKYAFQGGDVKYEDINHDGSIDQYDVVYLGNSNPKFSGGFGLNFRYADFSLRSLFTYRYGNKIINYARMTAENMYSNDNQTVTTNWRWRKEGDVTDVPRAVYQQAYNWLPSDRYVEDGSFLRLKYIQLNYSIPSKLLKKVNLNKVSLYCNLNNVFTLTNYSGVDPEISVGRFVTGEIPGVSKDGSKTPRSQDWNVGITVGF